MRAVEVKLSDHREKLPPGVQKKAKRCNDPTEDPSPPRETLAVCAEVSGLDGSECAVVECLETAFARIQTDFSWI